MTRLSSKQQPKREHKDVNYTEKYSRGELEFIAMLYK